MTTTSGSDLQGLSEQTVPEVKYDLVFNTKRDDEHPSNTRLEMNWRPYLADGTLNADMATWQRAFLSPQNVANLWNYLLRQTVGWDRLIASYGQGRYDLPCPTEYRYDGTELIVEAGPLFQKSVEREDLEAFIHTLQEKLDEMPEGIDIGGREIVVDWKVQGWVQTTLEILYVLGDHHQVENDKWIGDEDDLRQAIADRLVSFDIGDTTIEYDLGGVRDPSIEDFDVDDWDGIG